MLFYTQLAATARGRALAHARTAPLRLRITSAPLPRTHAGVLVRAEVRRWPEEGEEKGEGPKSVLVVFALLPRDCQHAGVDPRALSSGKAYAVGVWMPYSPGPRVQGYDGVLFASRYLIAEE